MFSPTLGRWATMDPIGYEAGDVDLYSFVSNRPTYGVDPYGTNLILSSIIINSWLLSEPGSREPRGGEKKTAAGTFKWTLKLHETDQYNSRFDIQFIPDKGNCKCEKIAFLQTVRRLNGGIPTYPGTGENEKANKYYEQFRTGDNWRADQAWDPTGDPNTPYISAYWEVKKGWLAMPASKIGNGPKGVDGTAIAMDEPGSGSRKSDPPGDATLEFEMMAVCIDTGEVYGGVSWGQSLKDDPKAKLLLHGGRQIDFVDHPSKQWWDAVKLFNKVAETKYTGWKTFPIKE